MTKTPTPIERVTAGYQTGPAVDAKRRRKIAAAFRTDPRSERILALKQRDPTAYAKLDVVTRTGAAMYEQAKQIVQEVNDGDDNEAA